MKIGIIDYGCGNLFSVAAAVKRLGHTPIFLHNSSDFLQVSHLILPGVGSFSEGMGGLHNQHLVDPILQSVQKDKIPLLGICLGMQLLAESGDEGGYSLGLGLIGGVVQKMKPGHAERIPHVGWNSVKTTGHYLFEGIPSASDFYFVHSYHFCATSELTVVGKTPYCGGIVSAVSDGLVSGVQFHPEKSLPHGLTLLGNFIERSPC